MNTPTSICAAAGWFAVFKIGNDELSIIPLACWAIDGSSAVEGMLVNDRKVIFAKDLMEGFWDYFHESELKDCLSKPRKS